MRRSPRDAAIIAVLPDDEHVRIHGKGGTVRTALLDDKVADAEIRAARRRRSRSAS